MAGQSTMRPMIETRTNTAGHTYYTQVHSVFNASWYKSDTVRRIKPANVSAFSPDNTGRIYYSRHVSRIHDYYTRTIWNGDVYRSPVGIHLNPGIGWGGWLVSEPDLTGELRLKIKDQKASLGIALAEYRKSARLFHNTVTYLNTAFERRRRWIDRLTRYRKRLRRWWRTNGAIGKKPIKPRPPRGPHPADMYLAFVFGWRPIAMDLKGSVDLLNERLIADDAWLHASVSRAVPFEQSFTGSDAPPTRRRVTQTIVKRHKAIYRIGSPTLRNYARTGIANPLEVMWDLVPFSFVVNTMVNIGMWLRSLDALIGVAEIRHYQTVKKTSYTLYERYGCLADYEHEELSRTGVQIGLSHMPFPKYKPSTSLNFVVTGLALLSQLSRHKDLSKTYLFSR